jgi:negative regulator of flagellin synthesis FlgM
MAKAAEALAATPEVREQRVAELRRRIDNHEYQVDADQVAHRMIVNFLREII